MPTSTFEHIGTVTLASAGGIDITGIPATYTDLIIKGQLRAATGSSVVENCWYYFNNDTTSNTYSDMRMIGYGTDSWASNSSWAQQYNFIGAVQGGAPAVTGGFTPFEIKVAQYANTSRWKFTIGSWGTYTYEAGYRNGIWESTAAINRFTMGVGGTTFATGSSVSIWGIKAE
jgi:hypothetical protein